LDLSTPVALAHWICGDGTFSHGGLLLCTDSFTIPECPRLIKYYSQNDREILPLLRTIVLEHMDSKMLYKFGLSLFVIDYFLG